jgi:hypothetical protein
VCASSSPERLSWAKVPAELQKILIGRELACPGRIFAQHAGNRELEGGSERASSLRVPQQSSLTPQPGDAVIIHTGWGRL